MGSISAPFIRYPIATSLLMVGVLFVGIVAYPKLPVAPLPQVDFPTIQVSALFPGASPETMASSVAQPLETQFAQIPGVAEMTSTSSLGSTAITIQFDLDRNIDGASSDIQSAINAAGGQLPKNLPTPPTYRKVNPADSPILLLAATSDSLPLTEVDDNVETKLAQQISQVPGVAQVLVGGQQKPAVGPQDTTQAGWADGKRGVFLIIYKQPGANVISTVDRIMAVLPRAEAAMPASIKVFTLSDRTQTIRAAVSDVQFTLLLTIVLVVMVIFMFLRSLWATVIPSVTVPLALLGACAMMWAMGYSLDNLSLMALTISVGFVVDDAIVMLEITRYIEEGEAPVAAALKGASEIGFTIISISVSLIAVLIPLLLMGGIIGRLFREFAVTLSMAIAVSAAVSLTLTPMMASRFLTRPEEGSHGRVYQWSEHAFDMLLKGYERGLDLVLQFRFITLCVFLATLTLSVYLYVIIPKGFFPEQDTGLISGISEGSEDISFAAMARLQERFGDVVLKDPAVEHVGMALGSGGGGGTATNNGRMFITLKPRDQRTATADQIIARLRPELDKVEANSSCRLTRTCVPADASRAPSTNTLCRVRTSTSSTSGHQRSWTN
jgi:multidrug efflux pump subunit AcrB